MESQYALVAMAAGSHPKRSGGTATLMAGDVWAGNVLKFGTTVDVGGRYSQSALAGLNQYWRAPILIMKIYILQITNEHKTILPSTDAGQVVQGIFNTRPLLDEWKIIDFEFRDIGRGRAKKEPDIWLLNGGFAFRSDLKNAIFPKEALNNSLSRRIGASFQEQTLRKNENRAM
jgi:hypothetical protein